MFGVLLKHQAKPGRRDELEAVWKQYMQPVIDGNESHLHYVYAFGEDADTVIAMQIYRSAEDAQAFLKQSAYLAYVEASRPLIEHEPEVTTFSPRWIKTSG